MRCCTYVLDHNPPSVWCASVRSSLDQLVRNINERQSEHTQTLAHLNRSMNLPSTTENLLETRNISAGPTETPSEGRVTSSKREVEITKVLSSISPLVDEAELDSYLDDLERRLSRAWFPPNLYESKLVVVAFIIYRFGWVSGVRIDQSSGDSINDNAALKAVTRASPVRPLPTHVWGDEPEVELLCAFDYKVFSRESGTARSANGLLKPT